MDGDQLLPTVDGLARIYMNTAQNTGRGTSAFHLQQLKDDCETVDDAGHGRHVVFVTGGNGGEEAPIFPHSNAISPGIGYVSCRVELVPDRQAILWTD
jgi:hypothetical protein